MLSSTIDQDLLLNQGTVLRTLAYFDVFHHPLTTEEVQRFGDQASLRGKELLLALQALKELGLVEEHKGYWALRDCAAAVAKREDAEARAKARMPKALAMSKRIGRFPFVRAVFLSGSMSKGCLAPDGDIDYFIITQPGRLWVARTLLVLYKKLFLLNSRRDFCVNYFIDTEHLTVEDRNRFTATEVVTLIPTYGNGNTEAFFEHNAWAFSMYPGMAHPKSLEVSIGAARRKQRWERWLSGQVGEVLDEWCMKLTWTYWKRKFSDMDVRTFDLALRTRTYVSKHHPRNFQQRVLDGYHQRTVALERKLGAPLR
ncbi:MAG TPA: nucleotidyltransferase domain-containing protein [Flavobacteriales bacterium]|jgi:hypothetical protein|nr:nucleotidyltransferase domain-containing protein [Flavobacteriales bacterium]